MGFQKSISYKNPRHGAPGPIGTSKSNLSDKTESALIQRILHQCYNWYILIFFVTKCVGNVDAFCIKKKNDAKCVDMVHIDAFCNKKY